MIEQYRSLVTVLNAIVGEMHESPMAFNTTTLENNTLIEYIEALLAMRDNCTGSTVDIDDVNIYLKNAQHSLSIPIEGVKQAYVYSRILTLGDTILNANDESFHHPCMRELLDEYVTYLAITPPQPCTESERNAHTTCYRTWMDEIDLIEIIKRVATLYLPINEPTRECVIRRAYIAHEILVESNKL